MSNKKIASSRNSEPLDADTISASMKHDLGEAVDTLVSGFSSKSDVGGNPPTIKSIENMMSQFSLNTREISLNAVSDLLSAYDEGDMIAEKKENTQKEG